MKKLSSFMALAIVLSLSSCAAIGGIFKAGAWVGIIIVLVVVAILYAIFGRKS